MILVPPVGSMYHPLNVCPLRTGVGRDVSLPSGPVCIVAGDTVPPWASNVIVIVSIGCSSLTSKSHRYTITSLVIPLPLRPGTKFTETLPTLASGMGRSNVTVHVRGSFALRSLSSPHSSSPPLP